MKRIILIGWSGSKRQYIDKYIDLYRKIGYNNIKVHLPSLFEPIQGVGLYNAKTIAERLYDEDSERNHVHCFSGGYYLYLMSLQRNFAPSAPKFTNIPEKLIIDSGPIEPNGESVARFTNVVVSKSLPEKLITKGFPVLWLLQSKLYYNNRIRKEKDSNFLNHNHDVILLDELSTRLYDRAAHPKKTICLYSDADLVLENKFTNKMITNHEWESYNFPSGKHAQLIREKNYQEILSNFLHSSS